MRHQYLCIAAILASALLGDAALNRTEAQSRLPAREADSPVLVLNMNTYRWKLPEFRMAGSEAYVVVRVHNTHDYAMEMYINCRSRRGRIPELSGRKMIGPGEYMHMDTRRFRDPMQKGEGVRVRCKFRSNSSAKVEAWVFDDRVKKAKAGAPKPGLMNG